MSRWGPHAELQTLNAPCLSVVLLCCWAIQKQARQEISPTTCLFDEESPRLGDRSERQVPSIKMRWLLACGMARTAFGRGGERLASGWRAIKLDHDRMTMLTGTIGPENLASSARQRAEGSTATPARGLPTQSTRSKHTTVCEYWSDYAGDQFRLRAASAHQH